MLFFLALFASYYAQEWPCEEGRGVCEQRVLMDTKASSAGECIKLVKAESPTANGVTWMKASKKCWADIGYTHTRNNGVMDKRYTSCGLVDIPDTPEPVVETEAPIVEPVAPVTAPAEVVQLNEPVQKPALIALLKKKGNGGCSCGEQTYCRKGYAQWDLDLEECKAKAIELGAKAIEFGAKDHSCMTHMTAPTGANGWAGVTCYEIVIPKPTYKLVKKASGGCSCKGEKYCRTGYKQWDLNIEDCKAKAVEIGAKAIEFGAKDATCMTHMSEITGGNGYPGVTCYDVVMEMPALQAFAASEGPGLVVQGFAALGMGFLLYGAGRHYLRK